MHLNLGASNSLVLTHGNKHDAVWSTSSRC